MLKPPVNIRNIEPACCCFCKERSQFGEGGSEETFCKRDPDQKNVAFDGESIYTTICDRFKRR